MRFPGRVSALGEYFPFLANQLTGVAGKSWGEEGWRVHFHLAGIIPEPQDGFSCVRMPFSCTLWVIQDGCLGWKAEGEPIHWDGPLPCTDWLPETGERKGDAQGLKPGFLPEGVFGALFGDAPHHLAQTQCDCILFIGWGTKIPTAG